MRLDPATLLLCHISLAALVAMAMAFYGARRRTYDGYWHYVAGTAAVSAGFVFYLARVIPGFIGLSVMGGNTLIMLAAVLRYDGTRRFLAGGPASRALYALPPLIAVWCAVFHFRIDRLDARTFAIGAAVLPLALLAVRHHLRMAFRSHPALHIVMAASFLVTGGGVFLYGALRLLMANPPTPPLWMPLLSIVFFFDIGTALGLALLNAARLDDELHDTQRKLDGLLADAGAAARTVRRLEGLLPLCPACRRVCDDEGYWKRLEAFVSERTGSCFSHGLCPDCARAHYPEQFSGA